MLREEQRILTSLEDQLSAATTARLQVDEGSNLLCPDVLIPSYF